MTKRVLSFLFYILLLGGAGLYFYNQRPCVQPIAYRIGTFDTKFGLSKAEFKDAVMQAEDVWSADAGKPLFKYDENAKLAVNLVYDERQATADKNARIVSQIDSASQSADAVRAQFLALELEYKSNLAEYNQLLEVRKNFRQIEEKRLQVNALAEEINALIKKYNYLVSDVNTKINTVNKTAGQEFEEGEYVYDQAGKRINIYEFKTRTQLVRVLAHEFGHAVGLDHNDNPKSIMYYLNTASNLTPSKEDTASLMTLCRL